MSDDQIEMIARALVGPEHQELYLTSASFHHAVSTLATMLPAMVNGLAESADRTDRFIRAQIKVAESEPMTYERAEELFGPPR